LGDGRQITIKKNILLYYMDIHITSSYVQSLKIDSINDGYIMVGTDYNNTKITGIKYIPIEDNTTEFKINNNEGNFYFPNVKAHKNGFIVVWQEFIKEQHPDENHYTKSEIFCQMYDNNLQRTNYFKICDGYGNNGVIELTQNGFIILWSSATNEKNIYGKQFTIDGDSIGDEFLVNTTIGYRHTEPKIIKLKNKYVIYWNSWNQDSNANGVYAQIYDEDFNKINDEFLVNTTVNGSQHSDSGIMTDDGFIILWNSNLQNYTGIYAQLFDNEGNKIGNEFKVNTYKGSQIQSSVVKIHNKLIVVWASLLQDGSGWGIFSQKLNQLGEKIEKEHQINIITENSQLMPSIVSRKDDYIIVWYSTNGIYSHLYDIPFSIDVVMKENENIINILNENINNFNDDVAQMKDINNKLNNWIDNGIISLEASIIPLHDQIQLWCDIMDNILLLFKENLIELKKVDDRITNTENIIINDENYTNDQKWNYYFSIYRNLFLNLKKDINILDNVINDINKYNNLGVNLGDALDTINNQKLNIQKNIKISITGLKEITNILNIEATKIHTK